MLHPSLLVLVHWPTSSSGLPHDKDYNTYPSHNSNITLNNSFPYKKNIKIIIPKFTTILWRDRKSTYKYDHIESTSTYDFIEKIPPNIWLYDCRILKATYFAPMYKTMEMEQWQYLTHLRTLAATTLLSSLVESWCQTHPSWSRPAPLEMLARSKYQVGSQTHSYIQIIIIHYHLWCWDPLVTVTINFFNVIYTKTFVYVSSWK